MIKLKPKKSEAQLNQKLKKLKFLIRPETPTKKEQLKIDGSTFKFKQNAVVSLKKRLTPRGKELVGPVSKSLSRKKFLLTFAGIF